MTKINDGGPAFPVGSRDSYAHPGLTLRDWFAGMAMQGWLASFGDTPSHPGEKPENAERVAALSYAIADAMLAERERGK